MERLATGPKDCAQAPLTSLTKPARNRQRLTNKAPSLLRCFRLLAGGRYLVEIQDDERSLRDILALPAERAALPRSRGC